MLLFQSTRASAVGDCAAAVEARTKTNPVTTILLGMGGKVAEGVRSTAAALGLAARYGVEMPITEQVDAILHRNKRPIDAIRELMSRPGRDEQQ